MKLLSRLALNPNPENEHAGQSDFGAVRRRWLAAAGLHVCLIIALLIYFEQGPNGRSMAFHLLALGIMVVDCGVIGFAFWITPGRIAALRRWMVPWQWPLCIGSALALFVFGLEMRPEWLYVLAGLLMATTLALIHWTLFDSTKPVFHHKRWIIMGGLVLMAVSLIRLYGLSVYPSIHFTDEPWVLSWGVGFIRTGQINDHTLFPDRDIPIYAFAAPLGLWLRLVGVGLWQGRLFTFLLTFPVILFSSLAARNLYGRTTAVLTALALLCSATLMLGGRIRHDIGLAVCVSASLWLSSEAFRRNRRALHFAAGLVMGWGMFAQYNALGLGFAMLLSLYGPRTIGHWREKRRWSDAAFWWYGIGGLLAGASVVIVQMLPYLTVLFTDYEPISSIHRPYHELLLQYLTMIRYMSRLELLLIYLGLAAALWRRRSSDWTLISMLIAGPVVLTFLAPDALAGYILPLAPFYGLSIGSLFGEGLARATPASRPVFKQGAVVAASFFLVINLGLTLALPLRHVVQRHPIRPAPPEAAQWVLDHVDRTATIVGEHYFYFWLTDYHYLSPLLPNFPLRGELARYSTAVDLWDALHPDLFIVDPRPTAYSPLLPLFESGYFESRGYQVAIRFDTAVIFYYPVQENRP